MTPAPVMYCTLGALTLGATEPDTGVRWSLPPIQGWGSPSSSIAMVKRPRQHGAWAGMATLNARHVVLSGTCSAPTPAASADARMRLTSACGLDDTVLVVVEAGQSMWCTVRREDEVLWDPVTPLFARWSIQMVALDPRKRGSSLSTSTRLPSTTGGLTIPFTIPFTIDAVTVTGQASLTNPGNISGPVRLRIGGPVQGPVVTHVSSGRSLVFASSVVLGAGEFLTVDMERREVLANGQSPRNGWVTERGWSSFEPGDNVWAFTAVSYDAGALLTVDATPAWM